MTDTIETPWWRQVNMGTTVGAFHEMETAAPVTPEELDIDPRMVAQTMYTAMHIRNSMESLHGGDIEDSLTDAQMAKLNPLIRNAVLTALYAWEGFRSGDEAHPAVVASVIHDLSLIPDYWEDPQLEERFVRFVTEDRATPGTQVSRIEHATCKHCDQPIRRVREGKWLHEDPDRSRGCRAASYRPGEGWDDSLERKWQATPKRGTLT